MLSGFKLSGGFAVDYELMVGDASFSKTLYSANLPGFVHHAQTIFGISIVYIASFLANDFKESHLPTQDS